jgi:hypothetical protein
MDGTSGSCGRVHGNGKSGTKCDSVDIRSPDAIKLNFPGADALEPVEETSPQKPT